jgi:hypothetical protein
MAPTSQLRTFRIYYAGGVIASTDYFFSFSGYSVISLSCFRVTMAIQSCQSTRHQPNSGHTGSDRRVTQ